MILHAEQAHFSILASGKRVCQRWSKMLRSKCAGLLRAIKQGGLLSSTQSSSKLTQVPRCQSGARMYPSN